MSKYENRANAYQAMADELNALRAENARLTASLHYANTVCMEQKHVIDRLKEDAERLDLTAHTVKFMGAKGDEFKPESLPDDVPF